jgi:hypothetical protein
VPAAPITPADVEIYVEDGPRRGTTCPVPVDGHITVGRMEDGVAVDLDLHDPWVSAAHVAIGISDGRLYVQDLWSKNGTLLGELLLQGGPPVLVECDEVIQLAPPRGTRIRLRRREADEPARLLREVERLQQEVGELRLQNDKLREENQALQRQPAEGAARFDEERVARWLDDFRAKVERITDRAEGPLRDELLLVQGRLAELARILGARRDG